jgi:hypothetical protein
MLKMTGFDAVTMATGVVSAVVAVITAVAHLSSGAAPSLILGVLWAVCAWVYGALGEVAARTGDEMVAQFGAGIAVGHGLAVVLGTVAAVVSAG